MDFVVAATALTGLGFVAYCAISMAHEKGMVHQRAKDDYESLLSYVRTNYPTVIIEDVGLKGSETETKFVLIRRTNQPQTAVLMCGGRISVDLIYFREKDKGKIHKSIFSPNLNHLKSEIDKIFDS